MANPDHLATLAEGIAAWNRLEPKELLLFIQTSAARFKRLQASALLKAR